MSKTEVITPLRYSSLRNKSKDWLIWTLIAISDSNVKMQEYINKLNIPGDLDSSAERERARSCECKLIPATPPEFEEEGEK